MARGLAVLIYHRVGRDPDPLRPHMATASEFRLQMRVLARCFRPCRLVDGLRLVREGRLPARSVAVTFDDGYADNVQVALPILRQERVPATFFVATSYLDGGRMWNDTIIEAVRRLPAGEYPFGYAGFDTISVPRTLDRRPLTRQLLDAIKYLPHAERHAAADELAGLVARPLPADLMMRREDLQLIVAAGMDVGGHTRTHPILSSLPAAGAEDEIAGGLDDIAMIIGRRPTLFAYPNGRHGIDYGPREVEMLRRLGLEAGFVTNRGIVTRDSDRFQAPRLSPLHRNAGRFGYELWRAYSAPEWRPGADASPEARGAA